MPTAVTICKLDKDEGGSSVTPSQEGGDKPNPNKNHDAPSKIRRKKAPPALNRAVAVRLANSPQLGGKGADPRMNRAVAIRLENPRMNLQYALLAGGFEFLNVNGVENQSAPKELPSLSHQKTLLTQLRRRLKHTKEAMEQGRPLNRRGPKGDPRMKRAVSIKLANPDMSLLGALEAGGFDVAPQEVPRLRKDQLLKRLLRVREAIDEGRVNLGGCERDDDRKQQSNQEHGLDEKKDREALGDDERLGGGRGKKDVDDHDDAEEESDRANALDIKDDEHRDGDKARSVESKGEGETTDGCAKPSKKADSSAEKEWGSSAKPPRPIGADGSDDDCDKPSAAPSCGTDSIASMCKAQAFYTGRYKCKRSLVCMTFGIANERLGIENDFRENPVHMPSQSDLHNEMERRVISSVGALKKPELANNWDVVKLTDWLGRNPIADENELEFVTKEVKSYISNIPAPPVVQQQATITKAAPPALALPPPAAPAGQVVIPPFAPLLTPLGSFPLPPIAPFVPPPVLGTSLTANNATDLVVTGAKDGTKKTQKKKRGRPRKNPEQSPNHKSQTLGTAPAATTPNTTPNPFLYNAATCPQNLGFAPPSMLPPFLGNAAMWPAIAPPAQVITEVPKTPTGPTNAEAIGAPSLVPPPAQPMATASPAPMPMPPVPQTIPAAPNVVPPIVGRGSAHNNHDPSFNAHPTNQQAELQPYKERGRKRDQKQIDNLSKFRAPQFWEEKKRNIRVVIAMSIAPEDKIYDFTMENAMESLSPTSQQTKGIQFKKKPWWYNILEIRPRLYELVWEIRRRCLLSVRKKQPATEWNYERCVNWLAENPLCEEDDDFEFVHAQLKSYRDDDCVCVPTETESYRIAESGARIRRIYNRMRRKKPEHFLRLFHALVKDDDMKKKFCDRDGRVTSMMTMSDAECQKKSFPVGEPHRGKEENFWCEVADVYNDMDFVPTSIVNVSIHGACWRKIDLTFSHPPYENGGRPLCGVDARLMVERCHAELREVMERCGKFGVKLDLSHESDTDIKWRERSKRAQHGATKSTLGHYHIYYFWYLCEEHKLMDAIGSGNWNGEDDAALSESELCQKIDCLNGITTNEPFVMRNDVTVTGALNNQEQPQAGLLWGQMQHEHEHVETWEERMTAAASPTTMPASAPLIADVSEKNSTTAANDDNNYDRKGEEGAGESRLVEAVSVSDEGVGSTPEKRQVWDKRVTQLKEFIATNGHSLVPTKYKENPKLGCWVHAQRHQMRLFKRGLGHCSKLSKERYDQLLAMGFQLDGRKRKKTPQPMAVASPLPTTIQPAVLPVLHPTPDVCFLEAELQNLRQAELQKRLSNFRAPQFWEERGRSIRVLVAMSIGPEDKIHEVAEESDKEATILQSLPPEYLKLKELPWWYNILTIRPRMHELKSEIQRRCMLSSRKKAKPTGEYWKYEGCVNWLAENILTEESDDVEFVQMEMKSYRERMVGDAISSRVRRKQPKHFLRLFHVLVKDEDMKDKFRDRDGRVTAVKKCDGKGQNSFPTSEPDRHKEEKFWHEVAGVYNDAKFKPTSVVNASIHEKYQKNFDLACLNSPSVSYGTVSCAKEVRLMFERCRVELREVMERCFEICDELDLSDESDEDVKRRERMKRRVHGGTLGEHYIYYFWYLCEEHKLMDAIGWNDSTSTDAKISDTLDKQEIPQTSQPTASAFPMPLTMQPVPPMKSPTRDVVPPTVVRDQGSNNDNPSSSPCPANTQAELQNIQQPELQLRANQEAELQNIQPVELQKSVTPRSKDAKISDTLDKQEIPQAPQPTAPVSPMPMTMHQVPPMKSPTRDVVPPTVVRDQGSNKDNPSSSPCPANTQAKLQHIQQPELQLPPNQEAELQKIQQVELQKRLSKFRAAQFWEEKGRSMKILVAMSIGPEDKIYEVAEEGDKEATVSQLLPPTYLKLKEFPWWYNVAAVRPPKQDLISEIQRRCMLSSRKKQRASGWKYAHCVNWLADNTLSEESDDVEFVRMEVKSYRANRDRVHRNERDAEIRARVRRKRPNHFLRLFHSLVKDEDTKKKFRDRDGRMTAMKKCDGKVIPNDEVDRETEEKFWHEVANVYNDAEFNPCSVKDSSIHKKCGRTYSLTFLFFPYIGSSVISQGTASCGEEVRLMFELCRVELKEVMARCANFGDKLDLSNESDEDTKRRERLKRPRHGATEYYIYYFWYLLEEHKLMGAVDLGILNNKNHATLSGKRENERQSDDDKDNDVGSEEGELGRDKKICPRSPSGINDATTAISGVALPTKVGTGKRKRDKHSDNDKDSEDEEEDELGRDNGGPPHKNDATSLRKRKKDEHSDETYDEDEEEDELAGDKKIHNGGGRTKNYDTLSGNRKDDEHSDDDTDSEGEEEDAPGQKPTEATPLDDDTYSEDEKDDMGPEASQAYHEAVVYCSSLAERATKLEAMLDSTSDERKKKRIKDRLSFLEKELRDAKAKVDRLESIVQ